MYRLLQKHGKKLMAVFSAFLMIAFALPSATKYGGQNRGQVIGTINGEKLYNTDLADARSTWDVAIHTRVGPRQDHVLAEMLPQVATQQIARNPLLLLLLEREAQRMGVTVSQDSVRSFLQNVPGLITGDEDRDARIRPVVEDLLLVATAFERASSAIKISDPLVSHELAELMQSITVNVAEVNSSAYLSKVPAPTADQIKKQFEQYADLIRGNVTATNRFGFGYKYPNRVKLQYIMVPRADVRRAVEASKTPYEWRVDAQKYYLQHQPEFQVEAPPGAKSATTAAAATRPTSGPTTQPFAAAEQHIKDQLIDAATDHTLGQIQDYLTTSMAGDYLAYHNAVGNTATTTAGATQAASKPAPLTSLGVPYDSVDYLKKLAAAVQQHFKVLPSVVSLQDNWLTAEDVAKLPGIGAARRADTIPFAQYVMTQTAPFLPEANRNSINTLQVLQPAQPVTDANRAVYLARVSAADPAHRPASLAEVEQQVVADIKTQAAFEMAQAEAQTILDQARQKGLEAGSGARRVIPVGPLTNRGQAVPTLALTGDSAAQFTNEAFKLLSTPASRPAGKPVELIPLNKDGRIFIAELGNVEAMWNQRSFAIEQARMHMMMGTELAAAFGRGWFDYASVKSRLNWQANEAYKESDNPAPAPEPPPAAPIF